MRGAGLDIGSRSIELVVVDEAGAVVTSERVETSPDVAHDCERLLAGATFDRLLVTGYGRTLAEVRFEAPSVTEIKAYARGARALVPECRSVLDIGGQDMKAIVLDAAGRVTRFEMNDRCAAGAGRFLEMMAAALRVPLGGFGGAALAGADGITLSSMCAVFAESEVVGLVTRGVPREDIARAVHRAIVQRAAALLGRAGGGAPVVFAGGGAHNPALVAFLSEALRAPVHVPPDPQAVGAYGAALLAADSPPLPGFACDPGPSAVSATPHHSST